MLPGRWCGATTDGRVLFPMAHSDCYANGFDEQTGTEIPAEECPECDSQLVTEAGETRCTECGLIFDEYRFDHRGPRTFPGDEDSLERTGAPLTNARHDRGLSTKIGEVHEGKGNELSQRKRRHLARLRREHSRSRYGSKADRNLGFECSEIVCDCEELPGAFPCWPCVRSGRREISE